MKVNNISGPMGAYQKSGVRRVAPTQETPRGSKSDGVELSKEAQQVLALREKLGQVPEVRQERIEELRKQIAAGTYRPDAKEVASRMLQSGVLNKLI